MPPKKQKTTLVTVEELIEAVTTRVTESMKEDLDSRFSRFERAFGMLAATGTRTQPDVVTPGLPSTAQTHSTLEEEDQPKCGTTRHFPVNCK